MLQIFAIILFLILSPRFLLIFSYQGFIQNFTLEGGHFFGDSKHVYAKQTLCPSRGSGGMPPPPQKMFEKIAALRLNLVGFGS